MKYSDIQRHYRAAVAHEDAAAFTVPGPPASRARPFGEFVFELSGAIRKGAGPRGRSFWADPRRRPLADWTIWPNMLGFTEFGSFPFEVRWSGIVWTHPAIGSRAQILRAFRDLARGG